MENSHLKKTKPMPIWSTVMMICILIFSVKLIFCWCQFLNILSVYLIVTFALVCVFEELFFQCNSTPQKIIIDKKRHNCNFTNKAINMINLHFVNDAKHFIYLFDIFTFDVLVSTVNTYHTMFPLSLNLSDKFYRQ